MAVGGLLILVVCFSRLYLQVHYPTDVAAGFLVALFWVFGLEALMLPPDQTLSISLRGCRIWKGRKP
jgi:undecaprenyl-diphosphatase